MTAEEHLAKRPIHWDHDPDGRPVWNVMANTNEALRAIRDAVAEEREACAARAEEPGCNCGSANGLHVWSCPVARGAAIRARAND